MILGLTGLREVGKSTIAQLLRAKGYRVAHTFGPGKAMCITYYEYLGIDKETAWRMVHGDLKDSPSPMLPGGVKSRDFMEPFGKFMGVTMGPEWTIAVEMDHLRRQYPHDDFVLESLVYEAPVFKKRGGIIIRVLRDGAKPTGHHTDKAQAQIEHDYVLENNGTFEELQSNLDTLIEHIKHEQT